MNRKLNSFFLVLFLIFYPSIIYGQQDLTLRDVKPPVSLPFNILGFLFWLVLLTMIMTGGLVFFFLKRKHEVKEDPAPVVPPWITAFTRIEQLKKEDLITKQQVKEYFTRLSDIIRQYLEARFALRAPEMTTEEFLWEMNLSSALTERQKDFLRDFLNACDMVKFARQTASVNEMEDVLDSAVRLIEETKPSVQEDEQNSAAQRS